MRVLMIDDDPELGLLMQPILKQYGIDLDLAFSPSEGFGRLEQHTYEALVLDMMLPEQDGMEVCRAIRDSGKPFAQVPIVAVTARADLTDRIVALECGLDDFIAKPVELRELVARIGAVTRRHRTPATSHNDGARPLQVPAGLQLSDANMTATFGTCTINLTELEMRVIQSLNANRGRFLSRTKIINLIGYDADTDTAMIDTIIYRVRQKFRDQGLTENFIKTMRGRGYSIKAEEQR